LAYLLSFTVLVWRLTLLSLGVLVLWRGQVDSPEQCADVLYNKLRLRPPSTTDAGKKHPSTSEEVLLKLQDRHPIVGLILRNRTAAKVSAPLTITDPRRARLLNEPGTKHVT
jgi:hypothetical protein